MTEQRVRGLVENLFRREAGRLAAALTRSFGPAHLDLAEEVVQEALIEALRRWPFHGVPDEPAAWLYRVARNRALDRLRRDASFGEKAPAIRARIEERVPESPDDVHLEGELDDDQLRLIFLCCHPALPRDARVALTLKTVGGFGTSEIARAFLAREATIAQRLVRAQRRIRDLRLPFEVPGPDELEERLEAVLEVIYLMFNEGYAAHDGDRLVRDDLIAEALRLVDRLTRLGAVDRPSVRALAALLYFQASRLPARVDAAGDLVLLEDQDRDLWDRRLVTRAFHHLQRATAGESLSEYHLQAAIAAEHAVAAQSGARTDWHHILELYDELARLNPSPIVRLNRAVAVERCRGPQAGLAALEEIAGHKAMSDYYLLHAMRAEWLASRGQTRAAREAYRRALACSASAPERRFLEKRRAALSLTPATPATPPRAPDARARPHGGSGKAPPGGPRSTR